MALFGNAPKRSPSAQEGLGAALMRAAAYPLAAAGAASDHGANANPDNTSKKGASSRFELVSRKARRATVSAGRTAGAEAGLLPDQTKPTVYSPLQARHRSVSAPMLATPLLGPLFGSATSKTSRELLQQLLLARATATSHDPGQHVAVQFDAHRAREALLRRDVPQVGAPEQLHAAVTERALESLLAHETLRQCPKKLLDPVHHLAGAIAHELATLDPTRSSAVVRFALDDLRKEFSRPWSHKTPVIGELLNSSEPGPVVVARVVALLRADSSDKFAALAAMTLTRSCFMGFKQAHLDLTVTPWLSAADRVYQARIVDYKGILKGATAGSGAKDAVAGITLGNQSSPLPAEDLLPGARAINRDTPNFAAPTVQEAIAFGNPHASGYSGTTNMFLHAASHFNGQGTTTIDGGALTTSLAVLLSYDGGHSIHEVYAVAHILQDVPHLDLTPFRGYHAGHARGLFVDQATRAGVIDLAQTAFTGLVEHFGDRVLE